MAIRKGSCSQYIMIFTSLYIYIISIIMTFLKFLMEYNIIYTGSCNIYICT